jgi:phosphoglycolate phosphatase
LIRAVIFDFDLTLADSRAAVCECVNHALRGLGRAEAEREAIHRTIGLTIPRAFAQLVGTDGDPDTAEFQRLFAARADEVMVARTTLFPEARGVLARLRADGARSAVVSTKFRYRIEATLARDGLLDAFDAIVGGEDVTRHKPDPEGLHAALATLGEPSDCAVFVGDHPVDAEAASRAGLRFVAALTGVSAASEFEAYPVERFIESLAELPAALASLPRRA